MRPLNTKKKFWVFAGTEYYPSGGMNDFKDSFDNYNEALAFGKGFMSGVSGGWTHIYDSENDEVSSVEK